MNGDEIQGIDENRHTRVFFRIFVRFQFIFVISSWEVPKQGGGFQPNAVRWSWGREKDCRHEPLDG